MTDGGVGLASVDRIVIAAYALIVVSIALWVSREKKGHQKDTADYFLAGKALPWWAIGTSLIAANISAEQVIGMSGSGFAIGLGIASYEWMAAITLIIVGKFFLPIFLEHRIYTMPQFLQQRYDGRVRAVMAVFWLGVYTFVNLTSILWLGALAISQLTALTPFQSILVLSGFALTYSLYGGLKAVALTDIIQVVMLVIGGLLIAYLTLDTVADGGGPIAGFMLMLERAPEKFDMILAPSHPFYADLPGLSVLIGGMWIMNLSYWGFNQYIIQRALAARDVREAQAGLAFAACLKLIVPVLVVFPGIAAFLLQPDLVCDAGQSLVVGDGSVQPICEPGGVSPTYDRAYPTMLGLAPSGVRGLIFAALVAAIVSSLGSMMNSIATIFTMDLVNPSRPKTSEHNLVIVGRTAALTAMAIAVLVAQPLLGQVDQVFQYIQDFTGFFTPPVVALFLLGMFWKRMTANAALATALGGAAFSAVFFVLNSNGVFTMPFMNRVGLVFLLSVALGVATSFVRGGAIQDKAIHHEEISITTSTPFNFIATAVAVLLIGFYWIWW